MVQLVMSCTFFFAYKHLTQRWQQATHSSYSKSSHVQYKEWIRFFDFA